MMEESDTSEPTIGTSHDRGEAGEKLMEGEREEQAEVEAVVQAPPNTYSHTSSVIGKKQLYL